MSAPITDATYKALLHGMLRGDEIQAYWGDATNAAEKVREWAQEKGKTLAPYQEESWQARAMEVYQNMYEEAKSGRCDDAGREKKNLLFVIQVPADTKQSHEVDELSHRMILKHVAGSGSVHSYRAHSKATITTLEKSTDVFGVKHANDDPEFLNVYNVWRRSDATRFITRIGVHAFKRAGLSVLFIRRSPQYRDYSMYGICVAGYKLVEHEGEVDFQEIYVGHGARLTPKPSPARSDQMETDPDSTDVVSAMH